MITNDKGAIGIINTRKSCATMETKLKQCIDPNLVRLIRATAKVIVPVGCAIYVGLKYETDPLRCLGYITLIVSAWRTLLSLYRRCILPPKHPKEYGKWAMITGCTYGIGAAFVHHLAREGMSVMLVSRDEDKLLRMKCDLEAEFGDSGVSVEYLCYDFRTTGNEATKFFNETLDKALKMMSADGGLGVLVNNVGIVNARPRKLEEFSDEFAADMLQVNVLSTTAMTRKVFEYMLPQRNGAIISISSDSCNIPSPLLSLYSGTKAFII
jgi:17beta-estradiol 17-dehydrogenase / very-long-chain 3-oxoacyl-CoA reductase